MRIPPAAYRLTSCQRLQAEVRPRTKLSGDAACGHSTGRVVFEMPRWAVSPIDNEYCGVYNSWRGVRRSRPSTRRGRLSCEEDESWP